MGTGMSQKVCLSGLVFLGFGEVAVADFERYNTEEACDLLFLREMRGRICHDLFNVATYNYQRFFLC